MSYPKNRRDVDHGLVADGWEGKRYENGWWAFTQPDDNGIGPMVELSNRGGCTLTVEGTNGESIVVRFPPHVPASVVLAAATAAAHEARMR